jgi:NAD-dependent dihydropyrimidine dehydrogenase PreA subunit
MKPQLLIDRPVCIGCAVCVDSCPTDVLRMDRMDKATVVYPDDCQACFLCIFDCPVDAITLRQTRAHAVAASTIYMAPGAAKDRI